MLLLQKVESADRKGNLTGVVHSSIPDPSSYVWGKNDISGSDAGRDQSTNMIKSLKAKAVTLELQWNGRSYAEIAQALQCFDYEYMYVTYLDGLTGTVQRKHFYAGDMSASSFRSYDGGIWQTATVRLIQSITDKV